MRGWPTGLVRATSEQILDNIQRRASITTNPSGSLSTVRDPTRTVGVFGGFFFLFFFGGVFGAEILFCLFIGVQFS